MTTIIREADLIESVADALQFISFYHPMDYIRALGAAYEAEQGPAAKDAIAQILTNSRMCAEGHRPICQDTGIVNVFVKWGMDCQFDDTSRSLQQIVDEGVRLAYNASFADHWGSSPSSPERWRNLFADSSSFRADFSRLAVRDGEVVGFVMSDEFDSETRARGHRTGYVDRVGTVRSVRGRGVATTLMVHCLHAMRESGCQYADLTVDAESPTGAGRLYERLGFAVHRRNEVRGLEIATLG